MRAALLTELPSDVVSVRDDVAAPEAAAGTVVLEVTACGICGTDLEILAGRSYAPELPFTLGHEPVGVVIACGPDVDRSWLGQRVTMTIFSGHAGSCAVCRSNPTRPTPCRTGDERLCYDGARALGVLGLPGGFAERLQVSAAQLVPVPADVPDDVAASLVDAGATAANAARHVPSDRPGAVLVVGAGPLGWYAAQLVAAAGHLVTVVEPNRRRRELVDQLGLAARASLNDVDGPLDAVVDCAGAAGTFARGIERLGPHGTYVVAGYGPVETNIAPLARKELTVRGVRSGRREDLQHVLAAVAAGTLLPPPIWRQPLNRINAAFAALRAGEVAGKAVIEMASDKDTT